MFKLPFKEGKAQSSEDILVIMSHERIGGLLIDCRPAGFDPANTSIFKDGELLERRHLRNQTLCAVIGDSRRLSTLQGAKEIRQRINLVEGEI